MGQFAMIMLDDAIRWAKRHGYVGGRVGDRLVLSPEHRPGSVSVLLDLTREPEGIVTVTRVSLEAMVNGDRIKSNASQ